MATISRRTEIELRGLALGTDLSAAIPFAASAVIVLIFSLHVDERRSKLFLSKSVKDSKLVMPSLVRRSTEASEDSFIFDPFLSQPLNSAAVGAVKAGSLVGSKPFIIRRFCTSTVAFLRTVSAYINFIAFGLILNK